MTTIPMALGSVSVLPLFAWIAAQDPAAAPEPPGPYSAHREHPFNRLHRASLHRLDGSGVLQGTTALDPLLFPRSTWPLEVGVVAELGATLQDLRDPETVRAAAPLARLVLQRDLWALHDWAAERARGAGPEAQSAALLRGQAERAVRALGLNPEELVAANADARSALELEGPDLRELLRAGLEDGTWIVLGDRGRPDRPLASAHASHFDPRSRFDVLLRHPGGRAAGERYLERLGDRPLATQRQDGFLLVPDLPQPPPGTRVALVRRANHVTSAGTIAPTDLVELVQMRTFPRTDGPTGSSLPEERDADPFAAEFWIPYQAGAELELDRAALLAGRRALREVDPGEPLLSSFGGHGDDPLAAAGPPQLTSRGASCLSCHGAVGLHSMPSFTGLASGPGTHHLRPYPLPAAPRRLAPAAPGAHAAAPRVWLAEASPEPPPGTGVRQDGR